MSTLFKPKRLVFVTIIALIIFISWNLFDDNKNLPKGIPPGKGVKVPYININASGRTSLQIKDWATKLNLQTKIPIVALQAYGNAAEVLRQTKPECGLGWTTIAGIAAVESKHGFHGLSSLDIEGNIFPHILGPVLDGKSGVMKIIDTDRGKFDGDKIFDRALGPFQFLPETWSNFGQDANGDGFADPNNIDDAALSAGKYLCFSGKNLSNAKGWRKAVLTYNNSENYLLKVRDKAAFFALATL